MKKPSAKDRKLRISLMVAMAVVVALFCGCGAVMAATQEADEGTFDAGELQPGMEQQDLVEPDPQLQEQDPQLQQQEESGMVEPSPKGASGDMTLQAVKPPKVKGVRTTAGYKKVYLKWKTVDKPSDGSKVSIWYRVYRNGRLLDKVQDNGHSTIKKTYSATEGIISTYVVRAVYVKSNGKKVLGPKSSTVKEGPVRPITYVFRTSQRAPYYTTYKGSTKGGYIKAGTRCTANGALNTRFNIRVKGKSRWMPLRYTHKRYAIYEKGSHKYYSKNEAENYVNGRHLTSKTSYLIWVSGYAQRVYLFKKSGGKWKCQHDYLCATGGMSAPSPSGKLKIWSHLYINHGLYYWSNFYSITAMHQTPSSHIGYPSSTGGCVRMYKESAKYIYDHVPTNTTVLVF